MKLALLLAALDLARSAEAGAETNFTSIVPVVDVSPFVAPEAHDDAARAACAASWDKAMTEMGFALIIGHGVAKQTVDALRTDLRAFFTKGLAYKERFVHGLYGNEDGGYTAMGGEAVGRMLDENGRLAESAATASSVASDPVESYICSSGDPSEWGKSRPAQPKEFEASAAAGFKSFWAADSLNGLKRLNGAGELPRSMVAP